MTFDATVAAIQRELPQTAQHEQVAVLAAVQDQVLRCIETQGANDRQLYEYLAFSQRLDEAVAKLDPPPPADSLLVKLVARCADFSREVLDAMTQGTRMQ